MSRDEFIDRNFPPEVVKSLHKAGFFSSAKLNYDQIEHRICQYFGYESIFEYGTALDGVGYHLSYTKKGLEEAIANQPDPTLRGKNGFFRITRGQFTFGLLIENGLCVHGAPCVRAWGLLYKTSKQIKVWITKHNATVERIN